MTESTLNKFIVTDDIQAMSENNLSDFVDQSSLVVAVYEENMRVHVTLLFELAVNSSSLKNPVCQIMII
jgi:hypothetical protein